MDNSIFSYCFSSEKIENDNLPINRLFGKYHISTDSKTPYVSSSNSNGECAIFGYAVNVITRECVGLTEHILQNCRTINEVLDYEKQLGGKYIIFFRNQEKYYILGDATVSIPIFYYSGKDIICTNNSRLIVHQHGLIPDQQYMKIRKSGEISQAMPFDITVYKEINQLIPNHYYDIKSKKAIRYVNSMVKQAEISLDDATEKVIPMIDALAAYYNSIFEISCPITAGRDSRVVLAFLSAIGFNGTCYTIKHPVHNENTQDIVVPKELCSAVGIPHKIIQDIELTKPMIEQMDTLLGESNYSIRTLRIAQTIKGYCGDRAIINGDIIGQIGKCSLHRDIPQCFATPSYFRCKLHNYSNEAKKQLKLWIAEIKRSGEKVNLFDLFSIENRMGRWAAQENLIYNALGQVYINIFNSRSIIYIWTAVNRKLRKKSLIHIKLIERKFSDSLKVPFETDENVLIKLSKSNGIAYWASSYMKYYIEKREFMKGIKYEKIDNNRR